MTSGESTNQPTVLIVDDEPLNLELLTQERWYRDTRYGYARGYEAKQYVANVQSYYETLVWMDTREHPLLVAGL